MMRIEGKGRRMDEWSASRPGQFNPGKQWIAGWVGPWADMDRRRNKE